MHSSMTFTGIAALFAAMFVGALIPGVSVLAVSARSAASGFIYGAFTTIGIVVGDIFFILVAIFGLSLLADTLGNLFVLIKYLGGAYLMWLGISLWRAKSTTAETGEVMESSLLSSFLNGLFITLGDQKAILFYLGFFPAFLDLSALTSLDVGIVLLIAIVTVGGVKLGYAYFADRAGRIFKNSGAINIINITAGTVMIGVGIFLVAAA